MQTSDTFFVIQHVSQDDNKKLALAGQFIINGTVEAVNSPASRSERNEPRATFEVIHLFEAKWILPPRGSGMYEAVKAFAESMGYETVEHEDFSYPERPPG